LTAPSSCNLEKREEWLLTAAVAMIEGAAQLTVPLQVSIEIGRRWGSMQPSLQQ
jgi:DNA polymerase I-like protein with 3'-5' exonuclease and polymerase domains